MSIALGKNQTNIIYIPQLLHRNIETKSKIIAKKIEKYTVKLTYSQNQ